jgi:hypothetical protein
MFHLDLPEVSTKSQEWLNSEVCEGRNVLFIFEALVSHTGTGDGSSGANDDNVIW